MVYDGAGLTDLPFTICAAWNLPSSVARGVLPQMAFGKEREGCFGHDKDVLTAAGY